MQSEFISSEMQEKGGEWNFLEGIRWFESDYDSSESFHDNVLEG